MNAHGVTVPSYLGVTSQKDVDVSNRFEVAE